METLYNEEGEVDAFKTGFYCSETNELLYKHYDEKIGMGELKQEEVEYLSKLKGGKYE